MNWIVQSVVISVTFLVLVRAVNWWQDRKPRVPVARLADPAPLPGEQLPRAGRFPLIFEGAADPAYEIPVDPMVLAAAAYDLGKKSAARDEVADQMAVLIAEMRAAEWRGEG